jgi:hypothetical protein
MEDGGWRGIDNPDSEQSTTRERARSSETDLRIAIVDAYRDAGKPIPPETGHCAIWLAQGYPPDLCLSVIRSKMPGARDKGLRWFDKAIAEAFARRASPSGAPPPSSTPPERQFDTGYRDMSWTESFARFAFGKWEADGVWFDAWGPIPPQSRRLCEIAAELGIAISRLEKPNLPCRPPKRDDVDAEDAA